MDMNMPKGAPAGHGKTSEAGDHLISAFDCYLNGDRKKASDHFLMACEAGDGPALFRAIQKHNMEAWPKEHEAKASMYPSAGQTDMNTFFTHLDDMGDEPDTELSTLQEPTRRPLRIGHDGVRDGEPSRILDTRPYEQNPGDGPVYSPPALASRLLG